MKEQFSMYVPKTTKEFTIGLKPKEGVNDDDYMIRIQIFDSELTTLRSYIFITDWEEDAIAQISYATMMDRQNKCNEVEFKDQIENFGDIKVVISDYRASECYGIYVSY